jgi:hypothetical protein
MQHVAETGNVKLYNGDKLIAELYNWFSYEIKPMEITQQDIFMDNLKQRRYNIKQDPEDGKWYWFVNGVKSCEIFPQNNT